MFEGKGCLGEDDQDEDGCLDGKCLSFFGTSGDFAAHRKNYDGWWMAMARPIARIICKNMGCAGCHPF